MPFLKLWPPTPGAPGKWVLRFDFGDTVIRYGSVTLLPFFPEIPTPIRIRAGTTHNFQFSAG
ncbi:MAG TPA: hypothetical protein VFB82_16190, partial [Blastocatellia bacterium]|nr:hypothetical protein [Blastocatellia bacterium]